MTNFNCEKLQRCKHPKASSKERNEEMMCARLVGLTLACVASRAKKVMSVVKT